MVGEWAGYRGVGATEGVGDATEGAGDATEGVGVGGRA